MLFVFCLFIYQYLFTYSFQFIREIWKSYILLRENTLL